MNIVLPSISKYFIVILEDLDLIKTKQLRTDNKNLFYWQQRVYFYMRNFTIWS